MDSVRDTVEDDPLLVAVIGAGVVLLLILIVALVVVLLRGRGREEEFVTDEFEDFYAPASSEMAEPTGLGPPLATPPVEERTEAAPPEWPMAGVGVPPVARPPAGVPPGPGIPPAGGTRQIERAPQHLAILVDRSRPDRKFDLKGTINVGRARDNHIVLDHVTVSRHHAWIKAEGEDFSVFDVGSANGTFVNDQKVEGPRRLEHGDIVRFGEKAFVFTKVF